MIKKTVARGICIIGFPLLIDFMTEPYADRGLCKSWLCGAGKLAGAYVIKWAGENA